MLFSSRSFTSSGKPVRNTVRTSSAAAAAGGGGGGASDGDSASGGVCAPAAAPAAPCTLTGVRRGGTAGTRPPAPVPRSPAAPAAARAALSEKTPVAAGHLLPGRWAAGARLRSTRNAAGARPRPRRRHREAQSRQTPPSAPAALLHALEQLWGSGLGAQLQNVHACMWAHLPTCLPPPRGPRGSGHDGARSKLSSDRCARPVLSSRQAACTHGMLGSSN